MSAAQTHALKDAEPNDPFTVAVTERSGDTIRMVTDALAGGNMRLAYQKVVAAGARTTAFHEGLIRILDPAGRTIPARDFIGAVETSETGRQIDCAALRLGLEALGANPKLRLAINMSARSIGYPRWTRILDRALSDDPGLGKRLILEITEASAILLPEITMAFMEDLQMRGIAFALDDFGAGFTSFRYLRDFHFDILKIDGQFIRGISRNPDNQVLARALVDIGAHFGMLTVAESVETAEDADWLMQAGVDCLQGYHFGSPSKTPTT